MALPVDLWIGGEDVDFLTALELGISTNTAHFRSAYARCAIGQGTGTAVPRQNQFLAFPAGAVTSAWLSFRMFHNVNVLSNQFIGFGLAGTNKGLFLGVSTASTTRLALSKYDGATRTELATEAGNLFTTAVLHKIDMQVVNYGATATVNVFLNGAQVITFSGNVAVSGMTNFDCLYQFLNTSVSNTHWESEIIVRDSDTRGIIGLKSDALTGAGTTNNWLNNTFSNINGTTISDANPTNINTTGTDQQYNITDIADPIYIVTSVKIAARLANSVGTIPTQVKLGYNSGGSVGFGTGAAKTTGTVFANVQQMDAINPVTGVAFVQADMNALQVDLQSA